MFTNFDLKVGWMCNNKCIHCVVKGKEQYSGDYTTKEIKKIIDEYPEKESICFTGGEPTIRKDFIELLEYCREVGVESITIQSNGRRFSDKDFTRSVSRLADSVLFTIHSHNEWIHDSITGVSGSWKQSTEGLRNLYETNEINIVSQTVLSRLNASNLHKTYDLIQSLAPDIRMNVTFPHPNGAAFENIDKVVPRYSEIKSEIQKIFSCYSHLINTEAIPYCQIYPYHDKVNITEDRHADSNIKSKGIDGSHPDSLIEDYSSLIMSEYRKPKECQECVFNNICLGVWKEYYDHFINNLGLFPIKA